MNFSGVDDGCLSCADARARSRRADVDGCASPKKWGVAVCAGVRDEDRCACASAGVDVADVGVCGGALLCFVCIVPKTSPARR